MVDAGHVVSAGHVLSAPSYLSAPGILTKPLPGMSRLLKRQHVLLSSEDESVESDEWSLDDESLTSPA